jgi:hypothetical protein
MNANSVEEIVTDAELEAAFGHSNFGSMPKRDVIKESLLKCLGGYTTEHTAKFITHELGLIYANKWDLTQKGKEYLYLAITGSEHNKQ